MTSQKLTILSNATYYVCIVARDGAGNSITASNNNYSFTVNAPIPNTWLKATSVTNAPTARNFASSFWTGATGNTYANKMIIWGGRGAGSKNNTKAVVNTGAVYDPATDTWTAITATNAPVARYSHASVWTGKKLIVWSGANTDDSVLYNDGGVWDSDTNTWTAVTTTGAPSVRSETNISAVWTGETGNPATANRMITWGGWQLGTTAAAPGGGIYNPQTNTWATMSTTNAPGDRYYHQTAWTGDTGNPSTSYRFLVWGGQNGTSTYYNSGSIYDPATDTWAPMSTVNAPSARRRHAGVWTGSKLVILCGDNTSVDTNTGGIYDPATDTWTATSTVGAPTKDWLNLSNAYVNGWVMIWANIDTSPWVNTGAMYNPVSDTWVAVSTTNVPAIRASFAEVVNPLDNTVIIWGGDSGSATTFLNTGAIYIPPAAE